MHCMLQHQAHLLVGGRPLCTTVTVTACCRQCHASMSTPEHINACRQLCCCSPGYCLPQHCTHITDHKLPQPTRDVSLQRLHQGTAPSSLRAWAAAVQDVPAPHSAEAISPRRHWPPYASILQGMLNACVRDGAMACGCTGMNQAHIPQPLFNKHHTTVQCAMHPLHTSHSPLCLNPTTRTGPDTCRRPLP